MKLTSLLLACTVAVCAAAPNNPLLEMQYRIPFDRIKAEHVVPAIQQLLDETQKQREAYKANSAPRTFENTMIALEDIGEDLGKAMNVVRHMEATASTPALRAAMTEILPRLSALYSSMGLDSAIYAKVKEFAATPEGKALQGPRKRLVEITLDRFRRNGVELNEADKKRVQAISIELSKLSKKFADNVLDSTSAFEIIITDETKLKGLPDSARAAARQSAKQKNMEGWRITLQAPSMLAVVKYADDPALREKIFHAYSTRATAVNNDNRPIILRILELRRERAKLLGFGSFADLMAADRMAKSGTNVKSFLSTLETKTRPFFDQENKDLLTFRKSIEGPNAPPLKAWDTAYYAEKMRKAKYDFDEEELRPYFAVDSVLKGLFGLVEKLYGIKVTQVQGVPSVNPLVRYYEIRDADGTWLSSFYADLYPRDEKRAGAWQSSMIIAGPRPGGFKPHLGSINGNLTAPVGDEPALFTKRDVETVFHEFGHLMHMSLSRVAVRGLNGVAWDFVELPSQFMENFTWEREVLDLFARHYKTGERIPEPLFQKMMKARTFRSASAQMNQLALGTMDYGLHVEYRGEEKDGDVVDYSRKILQRFNAAELPPDHAMAASFSHIFAGGYAAGYYSYKWAEVLDADCFTRFAKEGVFNAKTGNDFRRKVLERGNTEDPNVLFRDFMGRAPDPEALMRRSGLVAGQ